MLWFLTWLMRRLLQALRLAAPVRVVHHPAASAGHSSELAEKKRTRLDVGRILSQCPSLTGPDAWYLPTPWLASGHLATIACTLMAFRYDPIQYERQLIRVPDGGTIAIDVTPSANPNKDTDFDETPLLVVSHGLTGGSHESYVRNVLAVVTRPVEQGGLGWRAVVVNSRGCAGAPITSPKLYNGEVTDDLRCALAYLSHAAPDAPLYGIGFSLGANQQAKFVGEEGEDCPYTAAVVLGAPFDFVKGHVALSSGWLRSIYSRAMAQNLKTLVKRHREQLIDHPKLDWSGLFDNPHTTLFEFDSLVTAPLAGHPTAIAYYRSASANRFIRDVAVPLLSLSALNDPVVCSGGIPLEAAEANPNLAFGLTVHGGHLGWFEGFFRPRRWIAKPVVEFLRATHAEAQAAAEAAGKVGGAAHARPVRETVPPRDPTGRRRPQVGDEMVRLRGRDDIGFQRVRAEEQGAAGGEAVDGLTQGL